MSSPSDSSPKSNEIGDNTVGLINLIIDKTKRRSGSNPNSPSGSPTISRAIHSENVPSPVTAQNTSGGSGSAASSPKLPSSNSNANIEGIYRKFVKLKKNISGNPSFLNLRDTGDDMILPLRMTWSDFESEYEKEHANIPDPLKFPADEIIVKKREKIPRTVFSPTIGLVPGNLEPYVRDIIDGFYKDYLIVDHKSTPSESVLGPATSRKFSSHKSLNYGSTISIDLNNLIQSNSEQNLASLEEDDISLNSSSNSVNLPPLKSKLFNTGKQLTRGSSLGNLLEQKDLLNNSNGSANNNFIKSFSTNNELLKEYIPEKFGLELYCEVKELKFSLEIEPFFCSLYILDLDSKERITECFNFHLNSKQLLDSLKMNENISNIMGNQKQCIFNLNKYHPNMYFLLRIYHIFRGDIEKDLKPYYKASKPSMVTQLKSEIQDKCTGSDHKDLILQPFAWGVYPVFHRPTLSQTSSALNLLEKSSSFYGGNPLIQSPPSPPTTGVSGATLPNLATITTPPNSSPNTLSPPTTGNTSLSSSPNSQSILTPPQTSIPTPPPLPINLNTTRRRSSFLTSHSTPSSSMSLSTPGAAQSILLNKSSNNIEINSLYPALPNISDRSICDLLISDKDLKKLKPIPGSFVMSMKTITESDCEDIKGKISPSLVPLIPVSPESPPSFIRQIQDFSETYYPNLDYVNNLYIYPESAYIKGISNPNIQVEIKLVEDLGNSKAMTCIYPNTPPSIPLKLWENINLLAPGKPGPSSTTPYPPLESYSCSAVNFHDKRPLFTEEFKLKLPTKIGNHFIIFTFYNINVSSKKDNKSIVGYSSIPLSKCLNNSQINPENGRSDLFTFSIEQNENFESLQLNQDEQKKEKSTLFTFRIKLISSIFSQNSILDQFLKNASNPSLKTLDIIKSIQKIDRISCVKFFPTILNQLFHIMCSSANDIASQAFSSILHVIKIVDGFQEKKTNEKSRLLTFYSEYLFDYIPDSKYLYEEICRQWVNSSSVVKDFRLNWFLLDIMTKSMALSLQSIGKLESDLGRENRFKIEFQENLNKLVSKLMVLMLNNQTQQGSTQSSEQTNIHLQIWEFFTTKFPHFINNLFPLLDRGFLFNLIYGYLARFNQSEDVTMVTLKLNFLKLISDYEYFIPLNFPVLLKSIEPISDLPMKFFKRHFLINLIINEVESCIVLSKSIRSQAISTLKQLLKKHHYDPRYQSLEFREKISSMYFPFIIKMIDHYSILKHQFEMSETKDWLTCFIWILQYCSKDLLINWFLKETPSHQETFLRILLMLLDIFKSDGSIYEIMLLNLNLSKLLLSNLNDELLQSNQFFMDNIISILDTCSNLSPNIDIQKEILKLIKQNLLRSGDTLNQKYSNLLFSNQTNSYCEILSHQILKSINQMELLEESSYLFYLMLESNFEITNDISKMKIQSTVAISRLVVEISNMNNLIEFLNLVMNHVKESKFAKEFTDQVEEMINRINTIIKYSNNINQNKNDPEMVAEMYYRISDNYFESPNLRLTWLENLSKIHVENEQFDEASQCLVHCAYLITKYLVLTGKFTDILESEFKSICPNLENELLLPEFNPSSSALYQTQIWSLDNVIQLLEQTINLLQNSNRYELAIETYSLISKILRAKKDYSKLVNCLTKSKQITETLIEKSKDQRIFSRYYRVGFYGKKLQEQNSKEYIYKKPHSIGISTIASKLISNLKETYPETEVVSLSNAKHDDITQLIEDKEKIYLQIVSVEPFIEGIDILSQTQTISQFDQYFNLTQFISEVAFSQEGAAIQTDISKQQKKKTIFKVDLAFPYVKNRLEITTKKEIILSPIENAIELIKTRCMKLKEQLDTNPPKVNPLQQIIQGSVFPMVNEGPLKVCEIFLSKKSISQFNPEHVDELKKLMDKFLIYCGFTIRLSRSVMSHKHQDFQNMVEKQYEILKNQINSYIK